MNNSFQHGSSDPKSDRSIIEILEGFNRKERNLLIRDILGHSEQKLQLTEDFLHRIHHVTGVTLGKGAWWATDYHFDWLFASVKMYCEGVVPGKAFPDESKSMTATQEDADLVVADGCHVVIVEAKAYGAYSNTQVASKYRRFDKLRELAGPLLDLHFLLMSPNPPEKLVYEKGFEPLAWMPLRTGSGLTVQRVERCDASGNIDKNGSCRMIVEMPTRVERQTG